MVLRLSRFFILNYIKSADLLIKIDFGKYLRGLIGGPPTAMIDPHAHHILFKKGLGQKQKELVAEGQEIDLLAQSKTYITLLANYKKMYPEMRK